MVKFLESESTRIDARDQGVAKAGRGNEELVFDGNRVSV